MSVAPRDSYPETAEAIARIRAAVTKTNPEMDFSDADALEDAQLLLAEYDRILGLAQTEKVPRAYWFEHPKYGMELSLDPLSDHGAERGWKATPLYAISSTDRVRP